jgi:uncharacterized protein (TIGR00369 family)
MSDDATTVTLGEPGPISYSPMGVTMGVELVETGPERATLRMPVTRPFFNAQHGLHGGAVTALIDMAAGAALLFGDGGGMRRNATVTINVSFLEAVAGGSVRAEAVIVRRGGALAVAEVRVFDDADDRLVATGSATFRVFRS